MSFFSRRHSANLSNWLNFCSELQTVISPYFKFENSLALCYHNFSQKYLTLNSARNLSQVMMMNALPTNFVINTHSHQKVSTSSNIHEANLTQCSSNIFMALKDLSILSVQASTYSKLVVPLNTFKATNNIKQYINISIYIKSIWYTNNKSIWYTNIKSISIY